LSVLASQAAASQPDDDEPKHPHDHELSLGY
jgi:hypothetical protein